MSHCLGTSNFFFVDLRLSALSKTSFFTQFRSLLLVNMQREHFVIGAELPFWSVITLTALFLYFGEWQESTVQLLYAGSLLLVLVLLVSTTGNLLLASRLGLLFAVGAYPLGVKLISRDLYFSVFEFNTQTLEITTTMYALTLLALLGAYWGWRVGSGPRKRRIIQRGLPAFDDYYAAIFGLAVLFAIFAGALIVASSTGTIFEGAYGTGTEGAPTLGSASAIGSIAISVMFYCCLVARRKAYWWIYAVVAFYLLVWCQILRGLRQDVVSSVFSCIVLYLMYQKRDLSIKFKYIVYLLPAYLALELWGLVRSGLSEYLAGELSFQQLLDMGLGNAALMPDVIYAGTLGPIATTFANVVALFRWGEVDFIYGSSYLDFLLRTPPEFLYPDRPKDYAAMFTDYGLSSGGGFFELAEAYLNFGPVGAVVIPFCISFVIARFYQRALTQMNLFYVFALSSLLSVWLRGSWYQTFAFYKSFVAALVMYVVIHIAAVLFYRFRIGLRSAQGI